MPHKATRMSSTHPVYFATTCPVLTYRITCCQGLDEISPAAPTHVWLLKDGEITEKEVPVCL